jgi:hypothetical protein
LWLELAQSGVAVEKVTSAKMIFPWCDWALAVLVLFVVGFA